MDTLTLAIKKTLIEGPRSENFELLVEAKDIAHRLANNYTLQADDLRTKAVCMGNLMQMLKNEADKCARLRAAQGPIDDAIEEQLEQLEDLIDESEMEYPDPTEFGRRWASE